MISRTYYSCYGHSCIFMSSFSHDACLHIFSVIKRNLFGRRPSEFMLRSRSKICLKKKISLFCMQWNIQHLLCTSHEARFSVLSNV